MENNNNNKKERKRLYRSKTNKWVCGICGGLGDYFNIDPTIIRVIWAILVFAYGTGLLIYVIASCIIPREDDWYSQYR